MNLLAVAGLMALVALLCGVLLILLAYRRRSANTSIDSCHAGKNHRDHAHCKFDPAEVRRTALLPKPLIDTTGLPPADPQVAAVLAGVDQKVVERVLNELTGEVALANGSKIASRNSHFKDINLALDYVVNFYKHLGFGTLPGTSVTLLPYKVRGRTYHNVVAEIKGAVNPGKVLIIGSHLDSTAGAPWRSEPVAPGADDDASGSVAVLELARVLAGMRPGSTIRFCHFTGEEQGLWGSYVYSDIVAKEPLEVIGMLQMDMIGWCSRAGNRVDVHDDVDRNGSHALVATLTRAAARYGLKLNVVDTHNHAVRDRSDHAGFLDHGMKAVLISEEFTDDGFNPNYHTLRDRVKTLNLPYVVEVIRMVLAGAIELAEVK